MKKYSIFSRIFKWTKIYNEISLEIKKEYDDKKNYDLLYQNDEIKNLKSKIESLLKEQKIREEDKNKIIEAKNEFLKKINNDFIEIKNDLKHKIEENNKLKNLESEKLNLEKENNILKTNLGKVEQQLKNLNENNNKELENNVKKIDQLLHVFNKSEGTKGKLGEISLKDTFERIDPEKNIWIENLTVGPNRVEFAIKTIIEGKIKYIPIDSKVITGGQDTKNEILINKDYVASLNKQIKNVNSYVGQKNTTGFAILVLSSDDIYSKLFDYDPSIFSNSIEKYNVAILSPSTFFQFAITTKYTLSFYEKVKDEAKILEEVESLIKSINNFITNIEEGYKKLNMAFNKHLPIISRKTKKLKIGEIKTLEQEENVINDINIVDVYKI